MKEMSSGKWSQEGILKSYKLIDLFVQFKKKKKKKKLTCRTHALPLNFNNSFLSSTGSSLALQTNDTCTSH